MAVFSPRNTAIAALVLLAATAAILLAMGRVPICTCGEIKLFAPEVYSPDNSQQIADWYTPSHVIHGFLFYGATFLLARLLPAGRMPVGARLLLAMVVEIGWELLENSPIVIDRYRAQTIALDYYGDSVLNSICDVLAMMIGFWIARRLPVLATVALGIGLEILCLVVIRDNLTLNVLMLVHPVQAVLDWQKGAMPPAP